jgi:hypothetical protein
VHPLDVVQLPGGVIPWAAFGNIENDDADRSRYELFQMMALLAYKSPTVLRQQKHFEQLRAALMDYLALRGHEIPGHPAAASLPDTASPLSTKRKRSSSRKSKKTKGKYVEERMVALTNKCPESLSWTAKQFADHLKCTPAAVCSTDIWKSIKDLREATLQDGKDRARGRQESKAEEMTRLEKLDCRFGDK